MAAVRSGDGRATRSVAARSREGVSFGGERWMSPFPLLLSLLPREGPSSESWLIAAAAFAYLLYGSHPPSTRIRARPNALPRTSRACRTRVPIRCDQETPGTREPHHRRQLRAVACRG